MGRDRRGDRCLLVICHPALYVAAVVVIGSRQHALLILGHDAQHYRYLASRWQNELFANLFLMWPTFGSVEGFRKFHSTHHQYTNLPGDGNRHIWYTHDAAGELEPCQVFLKTRMGLALPCVPFYRLPDLHKQLMVREGFRIRAVVRRSVFASVGECIKPQAD